MNRSYKVIFNISRGSHAVVSEITKSLKKTKSTKSVACSVLASLGLGCAVLSSSAFATSVDIVIDGSTQSAYSTNDTYVGVDGTKPNGDGQIPGKLGDNVSSIKTDGALQKDTYGIKVIDSNTVDIESMPGGIDIQTKGKGIEAYAIYLKGTGASIKDLGGIKARSTKYVLYCADVYGIYSQASENAEYLVSFATQSQESPQTSILAYSEGAKTNYGILFDAGSVGKSKVQNVASISAGYIEGDSSDGDAYGIQSRAGQNTVTFIGAESSITSKSSAGNVYGIAYGVSGTDNVASGSTTISGLGSIHAITEPPVSVAHAYGVYSNGDVGSTLNVGFAQTESGIKATSTRGNAYGLLTEGNGSVSVEGPSSVTVNATHSSSVTVSGGVIADAYGISANGAAKVKFTSLGDIQVNGTASADGAPAASWTRSATANVYGLSSNLTTSGEVTGSTSIEFADNTGIKATAQTNTSGKGTLSSTATAFGISAGGVGSTSVTKLSGIEVSATAEVAADSNKNHTVSADAYGVFSNTSGSTEVTFADSNTGINVTATATATGSGTPTKQSNAYGIYAAGSGSVQVSKLDSVTVKGDNAYGIYSNGSEGFSSTISFTGASSEEPAPAITTTATNNGIAYSIYTTGIGSTKVNFENRTLSGKIKQDGTTNTLTLNFDKGSVWNAGSGDVTGVLTANINKDGTANLSSVELTTPTANASLNVKAGGTLNLNDVTFSNSTEYSDVVNNGTLNLNTTASTFVKGISGTGTTNVNVTTDISGFNDMLLHQDNTFVAQDVTLTSKANQLETNVTNASGTVKLLGGTDAQNAIALAGNIYGAGQTEISSGVVTSDKIISNTLTIVSGAEFTNTGTVSGAVTNNGSFKTTANGVTGGVENNATLELTSGALGSNITGSTGTTTVTGVVSSDKSITQSNLTVDSGAELTNTGTIASAVTVNAAVNPKSAAIFENTGTVSGAVTNNGSFKTTANGVTGGVENNATLELTSGALGSNITGSGTTTITGVVSSDKSITQSNLTVDSGAQLTNTGTIASAVTVNAAVNPKNAGSFTTTANGVTGGIANNGTLTLTTGALSSQITGSGTTTVAGEVTGTQTIAQGNLILNNSLSANRVILSDSLIWKTGTLATTQGVTGSKALVVIGSGKQLTGSVSGFQDYLFALDSNSKTQPMLTLLDSNVALAATDKVGLALAKGAQLDLKKDDKITLMSVAQGKTLTASSYQDQVADILNDLKDNKVALDSISSSVELESKVNQYGFDIGQEDNSKLVATVKGISPSGVTKANRQINDSMFTNFRSQMNDVSRRMGELRGNKEGYGMWTRIYGGKYTLGEGMKESSITLQIGSDKWFNENYYFGLMGAYTKADDTLVNGDNDQKNWSIGAYGGFVSDEGLFWDATLKLGRFGNDFQFKHADEMVSKADFHTWGQSFSLEGGWRFNCPSTNFYLEPQAEIMYGHLNGVTYTDNLGITTTQNNMDTFVARAGLAAGYSFSEKRGNVFVKASLLHDFDGKVESSSRYGSEYDQDGGRSRDLGGTWGEFALGGTYKASKNLNLYGEMMCSTKAAGVRTKWQGSIGARWTF